MNINISKQNIKMRIKIKTKEKKGIGMKEQRGLIIVSDTLPWCFLK